MGTPAMYSNFQQTPFTQRTVQNIPGHLHKETLVVLHCVSPQQSQIYTTLNPFRKRINLWQILTDELPPPQYYSTFTFQIKGHVDTRNFLVIDHLQSYIIIGCDFIRQYKLIPDLHARIATIRHKHAKIITVPLVENTDEEQNKFLSNTIQK
ncbi:hypothetical protein PR048_023874 [Dryococelus australis]|uniref:Uncharacterized protein n=1 Tax=Dryococelus australis TaxID=614101 RepID=A0ABQ9GVB7_9NEOP|nr:hypothetical protein PR048_023874 [Dryococelus australis]